MKNDILPIGKIIAAHGIGGNVRMCSYAESLAVFRPGTALLAKNREGGETPYAIKWVRPHTKTVLMSLQGVDTRGQAEALVGCDLYIDRRSLPELEAGDYYWFDIIGLSVLSVGGEYIGRVTSIMSTGSNDVYVVKDADGEGLRETLVPALASVVLSIDLEQKTMRVNLPDGLR